MRVASLTSTVTLLQNVPLIKHSGHIHPDLTVFQQLTCVTRYRLSLNRKSMTLNAYPIQFLQLISTVEVAADS